MVHESEGYGNERVQESAFVVKAKYIDVALAFPSSTCPHRKLELPLNRESGCVEPAEGKLVSPSTLRSE